MNRLDNPYSALAAIADEYNRARKLHSPMTSAHQGYAVILEELDEAWDAIKANDTAHAREEMIQVGAMVIAFLTEVPDQ